MADNVTPSPNKSIVSLSYRTVSIILLAIIAVMLVKWQPWDVVPGANARVIKVTGEANITAEPDEYVFNPAYEFKNANKEASLQQAAVKSTAVVTKLKELGVSDNKIKSNTDGSDRSFFPRFGNNEVAYTLQLTITVENRKQAQKIQDYLLTTAPTGLVSPQPNFSDNKRKELESRARDQATREARAKADQSAKNLGFKIGKVKSVEDGTGFGSISTLKGIAEDVTSSDSSSKLGVQPGENELHYMVTVTYYLR